MYKYLGLITNWGFFLTSIINTFDKLLNVLLNSLIELVEIDIFYTVLAC